MHCVVLCFKWHRTHYLLLYDPSYYYLCNIITFQLPPPPHTHTPPPPSQETTGHEPDLYRFLPRDETIYRVAMGMAIVGGATALVYLIRMAIGNVPPKRE